MQTLNLHAVFNIFVMIQSEDSDGKGQPAGVGQGTNLSAGNIIG